MRVSRQGIIAAVVVVAVGIAAGIVYLAWSGGAADAKPSAKNYAIYQDDRTMGSPKARVVLIEYAAPSCPHCARLNATVIAQVKKDFVASGKVLYVLRMYPISAVDGAVEMVARCQPPAKYFSYLDFMFAHQQQWDPEYDVADVRGALKQLSAQMGVSADAFERCIADKDGPDRINRIAQDAQMRYDIHQVPTLVLNGSVVPQETAVDYAALKARLAAEVAKN